MDSQSEVRQSGVQAEPSRFNLAVVAKERQRDLNAQQQQLQDMASRPDEKWVIKDTENMSNFKDLIPDPALEYQFELDDF